MMGLPEWIEMAPLIGPVRAEVAVPGSKSITNRALVLAALGSGRTRLEGALWSEDTQVMVECLRQLGFEVAVMPDPQEPSNRTILVDGLEGRIPRGGTPEKPLELFVGNAGTAARFLAAMVCLGNGVYRLSGVSRMHERPQAALFHALEELGYRVEASHEKLPAVLYGKGPQAGRCKVSVEESSQFASALVLSSKVGGWVIDVLGENAEELPYVEMTVKLMESFPNGGVFRVEPDASSGSYFWAAGWLLSLDQPPRASSRVIVRDWPQSGWQVDARFNEFLPIPRKLSRERDLGDSIMMAIVLSPFSGHQTQFTDLGRLRLQECERVVALRTELTKCGAEVLEHDDTLLVSPSPLHGAEIETYEDHRVAMCFGILGLKVPGIKIKNPACVKKTFPNFFQKLATAPPHGLGATILDGMTRRKLEPEELFAG
jgi:3-phosphoshikimate 1-carboxyvinyltransferase